MCVQSHSLHRFAQELEKQLKELKDKLETQQSEHVWRGFR